MRPGSAPTRSSCCQAALRPATLVSLPRDSYVPIPGHGRNKLNAAYAFGGAPLLVRTVETVTGIRIDHYAEIGFGGFVGMTDAVGGVKLCPTRNIRDKYSGLHVKKGCQEMDGATALGYVRARYFDPKATWAGCSASEFSARCSRKRSARRRC
jgi:LCP family protein required for cell wall assembly